MAKPIPNETKEEKTRRKLLKELNPIADLLLSLVLLLLSPILMTVSFLHDKVMFKFLNKTYIYNVSWEDPRMDHRVFHLDEQDHVITIASAGCNALDYIIEGAKVTAVDFNSCQIALTELKKVAIIHLEFEQFFEIFSKSNMELLREVYGTKLRPSLSAPSAEFWDDGIHSIKSFMYSGTSGNMSWVLFQFLLPIFGLGFIRRDLVTGISPDALRAKLSRCEYRLRSLAWIMDNLLLRGGSVLAGVPERQLNLGLHRPNNLAMVIERIFFNTDLVNDNYFYAGYILGYYQPHNCPRYLKKENFDVMKKNLKAGKLHLVHGTLLYAIDNVETPITVASLLDHMDWMTDRMINEEITHIIRKMDPVRGKIFWRTFADDVHSAPLAWLEPEKVDDRDDRVGMYWTTWIAQLKNCRVAYEERVDTKQTRGLLANLWTGAKIVTFPLLKPFISSTIKLTGHANKMESFYKWQKDGYDAFREGLLHARPILIESLPLKKEGKMIWIDVGGGTARNLEFFTVDIIRKYFKKIVILDISASLLEIAQQRINKMGLNDIVTVVEADCTDDASLSKIPVELGTVDIITMSYSLSMIPNQQAAINNSTKLLKGSGQGILAIADFFLEGNHDDCLPRFPRKFRRFESSCHKAWFAMDHVHLLGERQLTMGEPQLERIWDNRFRGKIPFMPFFQPYQGVVILQKK
jgi:betaine lipid synthase